jgi:hypothetical protein
MKKNLAVAVTLAVAPLALMTQSASALIIDAFDGPTGGTVLSQTGVGTASSSVSVADVLGGNRYMSINLTSASGTSNTATMKADNLDQGALALDLDSLTAATFTIEYGHAGNLNVDLSQQTGIIIEVIASDLPALNNTITLTSAGGTSVAPFVIPGLISIPGGLASPTDVFVPFSAFAGNADLTDLDTITFTLTPFASADYTIAFFATSVPEPTNIALLAPAGLLLARRRRA